MAGAHRQTHAPLQQAHWVGVADASAPQVRFLLRIVGANEHAGGSARELSTLLRTHHASLKPRQAQADGHDGTCQASGKLPNWTNPCLASTSGGICAKGGIPAFSCLLATELAGRAGLATARGRTHRLQHKAVVGGLLSA